MKTLFLISLLLTCINSYACKNPSHDSLPINTEITTTTGNHIVTQVEGPFSIQEIENKHTYAPAGQTLALPFGNSNKKWKAFKEARAPGDEFYFINTKAKTECCNNYLEKYVLVRNKCVISKYIVRSNGIVEGK